MTRYLLDTDVLIDYAKGVGAVVSQVQAWERGGDDLCICRVQVVEFFAGVRPGDRSAGRTFLSAFRRWSITELAAIQAGVYRFDFARMGLRIATPDAIIAGVARTISATLVTRNVRHFPMTDIRIVTI